MVIDTSALLAILFNEPDAEYFESTFDTDSTRLLSAASLLEATIVVEARSGKRAAGNSICFCTKRRLPSFRLPPSRPRSPATHIGLMVKDDIQQGSITEIALPTRWRKRPASRYYSKAAIFRRQTSLRGSFLNNQRALFPRSLQ